MSVGLALMGVGAGLNAYSTIQRGKLARTIGRHRKKESIATAKQAVAVGQRASFEEKRKAEFLASRALAVAAAGGGGADDPTVTKIISDINGEGAYRSALAMYDAEEQSRKIKLEGEMAEFTGEQEYKTSKIQAFTGLLGAGGSMASSNKAK